MIQKIFFLNLIFISSMLTSYAEINREDIIPGSNNIIGNSSDTGMDLLNSIFIFFRESIFNLLALISIGAFLYIGATLIVAVGNPEKLTKAWASFTYAIIGIAVVSLSWAIVNLIAGLNF